MHQNTLATDPYGGNAAQDYELHHDKSLRNRLTTWRERRVLAQALAASRDSRIVLDLPCGTGRFWPAIQEAGAEEIIAGDASDAMLAVAAGNRLEPRAPSRLLKLDALAIDLPDNAVTFAACMRFYHHLARADDRRQLLDELARVSSGDIAISLWTDGNLTAWRRRNRPAPQAVRGYGRRICRPRAEVEHEFDSWGYDVIARHEIWPWLSMWRLYLLRARA